MPQGGIDDGEDFEIAALRELKEEIGTDKASILRIHDQKIKYDLPDDLRQQLWSGKYAGQEQIWVAMRFEGQDSDICLDADDHPEFSNWQWVNLEKTVDLIVPFKRHTYKILMTAFKDITG